MYGELIDITFLSLGFSPSPKQIQLADDFPTNILMTMLEYCATAPI